MSAPPRLAKAADDLPFDQHGIDGAATRADDIALDRDSAVSGSTFTTAR